MLKVWCILQAAVFYDNIPRVLPKDISAEIDVTDVEMPKVIKRFAEVSDIDRHELYRVFNMGVGYIFVCISRR